MTIAIDVIIGVLLIGGALAGFKKGLIYAAGDFLATLSAIVLAFFLKNPLSVFLYTNLPFLKFTGIYKGITVLNIVIYEAIAYLIVLSVLFAIVKIVIKFTNIFERLIEATLVLALPSKLFGLLFGLIESYLIVFVALFIINNIPNTTKYVEESNVGQIILKKTPFISKYLSSAFDTIDEIYEVALECKDNKEPDEANKKAFEILIKNKVLTTENANILIEKGKINIDGAKEIIDKY